MYKFICLAVLLAVANSTPITFNNCGLGETSGKVLSLEISGCEPSKMCTFQRGSNITIDIDYETTETHKSPKWVLFAIYTLKSGDKWEVAYDLSGLKGFDSNACDSTACPVQKGVKQHLKYVFEVPEDFLRDDDVDHFLFRTHLEEEHRYYNLFCAAYNVLLK